MSKNEQEITITKAQIARLILAVNDLNTALVQLAEVAIDISKPLAGQEQAPGQLGYHKFYAKYQHAAEVKQTKGE